MISSAGLQSDYCCIFDSGTTIFGVGTIDKIDIKVPTSGTEIDTLNTKGKHEGIGSVIGDDVHGAGIVLVVDVLIWEDDVFVDGVDGGIGEDYDEEDEDYDRDYTTYQGAVGLLLFVAEEGGVGEEV